MLRRIRGTVISFYQSRISKVLAPVIVAALTLLLFMSGSVRAYATDYNDEWIENWSESWVVTNVNAQPFFITSNSTSVYHGYHDITFSIHLQYFLDNNTGQAHNGLLTSTFNMALTQSSSWPMSNMTVTIEGYDVTSDHDVVMSQSQRATNGNSNNTYTTNIQFTVWNYLHDYEYVNSCDANIIVHARWWFWNGSAMPNIPNCTITHLDFSQSFMSGKYDESYILGEIANKLETLVDSDSASILQDIDDNIVQQNNLLQNDSTGVSENIIDINNSYNSVQTSADTAVDDAIHSYDNQLEQVEDIDLSSFFNTQRYGLNFWRSVGEFILDSANLGYIATGLIVVTVVNLFVFLLRL